MDTLEPSRVAALSDIWTRAALTDASADTRAAAAAAVGGVLLRWPALAPCVAKAATAALGGVGGGKERERECEREREWGREREIVSLLATMTTTTTAAVVSATNGTTQSHSITFSPYARSGASLLVRELCCAAPDIGETFTALQTLSTALQSAARAVNNAPGPTFGDAVFLETAWRALPEAANGLGRTRARRALEGWLSALGATLGLGGCGAGAGEGTAARGAACARAAARAAADAVPALADAVGRSVFEARLDDDGVAGVALRRILDQVARGVW